MNENLKALITAAGAVVQDDGIMFATLDIFKLAKTVAEAAAQVCTDNNDTVGADAIKAHFGLE